jgi:hypothetical protein
MRNKTALVLTAAGLGAAVMIVAMVAPARAGSGTGRLMQVSMQLTMHMSGMPAMPPRTIGHQVCMPPEKFDPEALQRVSHATHGQCHVEHFVRHGSDISYDVICTAPESVTSHVAIHLDGNDAFTGTTHTTMNVQGHAMSMDGEYSAKRIGSCTYTPPASS